MDTGQNLISKFESSSLESLSNLVKSDDTPSSNCHQLSSSSLNEKVAQLASSIYTELEKIVKTYGRDIVKELMPIVVNILEALDVAYHDKEELLVENELLKDDYEKLLLQYEREKHARKDTEIKLFQSEDSFSEQKRDYEDKVKSLESIVRMIDLKSKNTSDHVLRLEEKETELKREYNKLHERYTELFKTHCDYLDRTKILFGQEGANRLDISSNSSIKSNGKSGNRMCSQESDSSLNRSNKLLDLLRSSGSSINRTDLISCLRNVNKSEINAAISSFMSCSQDFSSSSTLTIPVSVTCSLTSLNSASNQQKSVNDLSSMNQITGWFINFFICSFRLCGIY